MTVGVVKARLQSNIDQAIFAMRPSLILEKSTFKDPKPRDLPMAKLKTARKSLGGLNRRL